MNGGLAFFTDLQQICIRLIRVFFFLIFAIKTLTIVINRYLLFFRSIICLEYNFFLIDPLRTKFFTLFRIAILNLLSCICIINLDQLQFFMSILSICMFHLLVNYVITLTLSVLLTALFFGFAIFLTYHGWV